MNPCIATYLELCRRFEMPPPWQCCAADERSFVGPADPDDAIAHLSARHSKEQLTTSGIISVDEQGLLAMHPLLAAPNVVLFAVWDRMRLGFTNLVTNSGCVIGTTAPAFEILGDTNTFSVLAGNDRMVFVTDSVADAILLRSFSMAAAPVAGVERLNQEGIKLLCEYFGVRQHLSEREEEEENLREEKADEEDANLETGESATESPKEPGPVIGGAAGMPPLPRYLIPGTGYMGNDDRDFVKLVFVRWSPSRMSKAESSVIKQAVDDLIALKRFRRLDVSEIGQWTPKDEEIEAMRFALQRNEADWLKGAFLDSVYAGVGSLGQQDKPSSAVTSQPNDLPSAIAQLNDTLFANGDEKSRQRRKEALRNYHRVVDQCITAPMLREAQAEPEPFDRALQLQFVQLNALFLEKVPAVREQMHQKLGPQSDEPLKRDADKSVSELLDISTQLVGLAKEVMKWKPRTKSMVRNSIGSPPSHTRRFGDSDLVMRN